MSDDPCECLFNHEAMMRRLINILRQTQEECTDEECSASDPQAATNTMVMMALMSVFAMVMFMTRPNSLRGPQAGSLEGKPSNNSNNTDDPPPPPPTV
uniref:Small integral membrane protein 14 n=1 Tax=Panagrellus redivivus TaxID=6233 RepID=A0A7E4VZ59_PANRE